MYSCHKRELLLSQKRPTPITKETYSYHTHRSGSPPICVDTACWNKLAVRFLREMRRTWTRFIASRG